MITIKLQGGLGNQLFQYAYAKALQALGKQISFDVSFFEVDTKYTKRSFSLLQFNIDTSIPMDKESHAQTLLKKILGRIDVDRRVRYIPIDKNKDNYLADGYYNSEKYFTSIREVLLKELVLKETTDLYKEFEKKINEANKPLIVHARRGDYLTSSGFVILGEDYYQKALAEFDTDCEIFGFSDDPEWLKNALKRPFTLISGQGLKDYEELSLMALGRNFIIANSTFSWWGAWLSRVENKKIVAPKKWFKSLLWWRAERDIIPKEWKRV